ncbi:MAG: 16S rRNA (adenine(1518)-N(6)/adenine(1519)-N(6))-dimethyltransferase, partial [Frisingicoccus sp.]|nr:16S rRNA (adenine(1518)-N(6)/adenine(1519)-N(6))-dimethyltransferase [Frisingicoccus sp.]
RLTRHESPAVEVENEALMFNMIRASFNQRRKTLQNGLKNSGLFPVSKEEIIEVIKEAGLPETVRGEALTLEQFARLSNLMNKKINK